MAFKKTTFHHSQSNYSVLRETWPTIAEIRQVVLFIVDEISVLVMDLLAAPLA